MPCTRLWMDMPASHFSPLAMGLPLIPCCSPRGEKAIGRERSDSRNWTLAAPAIATTCFAVVYPYYSSLICQHGNTTGTDRYVGGSVSCTGKPLGKSGVGPKTAATESFSRVFRRARDR